MSLNRVNPTRDANEAPIVQVLQKLGASVWRIDTPCDLIVGVRVRPPAWVAEVRKRHRKCNHDSYSTGPWCLGCRCDWPCDAIRAIEVIEQLFKKRTILLEVKVPGGRTTEHQRYFASHFLGEYHIVHTPEEAVEAVFGKSVIVSRRCR